MPAEDEAIRAWVWEIEDGRPASARGVRHGGEEKGAAADVLLPRGLEADGSPPPCLCLSI